MSRPSGSPPVRARPSRRPGSVAMVALSILTILGIVIGVMQFMLQSSHKQFFHAYYNEKTLSLIDGINAIARGKAQDRLAEIIEARGEEVDLTEDVMKEARGLRLWEEGSDFEPTVEVLAKVDPKKILPFARDNEYQTIKDLKSKDAGSLFKDGEEVEGIVEIQSKVGFAAFGKGLRFSVPKRTVRTEYEFKRILRVPQFFRQFAVYVKDASVGGESFDSFSGTSGYNRVSSDIRGYARTGGAVFVSPGGSLDKGSLPRAEGNPFKTKTGYIYLGGSDPMFLNLAAGDDDSEFSEGFHLYKGATTNFYKVWDTDFSSFMEQAKKLADGQTASNGSGGFFSRAWSWVKNKIGSIVANLKKMVQLMDQLDELELAGRNTGTRTSGPPFYYFARKDFGYAAEWADPKYARFGFGSGGVFSSGLHLYGVQNGGAFRSSGQGGNAALAFSGSTMGATLVMGKVYRRVLSLSGYKQRRGADDPSQGQSFEIQAGPIEYFPDMDALMKRKMAPLINGSAPPDDEKPIWVWDARVAWSREGQSTNGTWMPISGPGLVGRIVPGMGRFWTKEDRKTLREVFQASLMPPEELVKDVEPETLEEAGKIAAQVRNLQDFPDRIQGGVSPLLLALYKKKYFTNTRMQRPWVDVKGSPYFEELVRAFAYSSYMTPEEMEKATNSGDAAVLRNAGQSAGESFDENDVRATLEAGHRTWEALKGSPGIEKMDPQQIIAAYPPDNPRGSSKGALWVQAPETPEADKGIFPFSLPDPWAKEIPQGQNSAGVKPHPNNFEEAFEKHFSDKDEFFDRYIRPVMTNPGRVLPYNYSMRFMFDELKELFARGEDERAKLLATEVAPEVREGIGFRVKGENDYLDEEDGDEGVKFDRALDDDLLKKIHAARQGSAYLKKGFFFMDEFGPSATSPGDVDVGEPYEKGGRYAWDQLTEEEFRDRFGPSADTRDPSGLRIVNLGSAVRMQGDLGVFGEGPTLVRGGGVLLVPGEVTIGGTLGSNEGLTIVANRVVFKGDIDVVRANVIAKEVEFGSSGFVLRGFLACEKWNAAQAPRSGRVLLAYEEALKSATGYLHIIEPRIHRISIEAGG